MWQHEFKQAGLGCTSPLSGYRGLDSNRHGSFRSGCSPELQEGRIEIPKPVLWPKTPVCSSRKRVASRGGHAGCGMDGWKRGRGAKALPAQGMAGAALRAGGRAAGPRSPLPRGDGRWDVPAQAGKPFRSSAAKLSVTQPRFPDSSFVLLRPIKNNPCAVGSGGGAAALAGHSYFRAGLARRAGGRRRGAARAAPPRSSPSVDRSVVTPLATVATSRLRVLPGTPVPLPFPAPRGRLSCFRKKPGPGLRGAARARQVSPAPAGSGSGRRGAPAARPARAPSLPLSLLIPPGSSTAAFRARGEGWGRAWTVTYWW